MFSGFGISADGTNFARRAAWRPFLRADDQTIPRSRPRDQSRFNIKQGQEDRHGGFVLELPERLYDDPEELTGGRGRPWRRRTRAAWAAPEGRKAKAAPEMPRRQEKGLQRKKTQRKRNSS